MFEFISPVYAQTEEWSQGRCVATLHAGKQTFSDIATIQGLECLFYNILQVIAIIAGLVFLFMFISYFVVGCTEGYLIAVLSRNFLDASNKGLPITSIFLDNRIQSKHLRIELSL